MSAGDLDLAIKYQLKAVWEEAYINRRFSFKNNNFLSVRKCKKFET
jgi:hypothetical protein